MHLRKGYSTPVCPNFPPHDPSGQDGPQPEDAHGHLLYPVGRGKTDSQGRKYWEKETTALVQWLNVQMCVRSGVEKWWEEEERHWRPRASPRG